MPTPFPTAGESPYGAKVKAYIDSSVAEQTAAGVSYAGGNGVAAGTVESAIDALADRTAGTTLATPINFDSVVAQGVYRTAYSASNVNAPLPDGGYLEVHVGPGSPAVIYQTWRQAGGGAGEIWERKRTGGTTWSGWVRSDVRQHAALTSGAHNATAIAYAGGSVVPAGTVEDALDALDRRGAGASLAPGTNADTLIDPGVYSVYDTTWPSKALNFPHDNWSGYIEVLRHAGTQARVQRATFYTAYPTNPGFSVYERTRTTSSVWTQWVRVDNGATALGLSTDLDVDAIAPGYYVINVGGMTAATNKVPVDGWQGTIHVVANPQSNVRSQIATQTNSTSGSPAGTSYVRTLHGTASSGWRRLLTPSDLEATSIPVATNLNTLTSPGSYRMAVGNGATLENNYPVLNFQGFIDVTAAGGGVVQIAYRTTSTRGVWVRSLHSSASTWTAWSLIPTTDAANTFTASNVFQAQQRIEAPSPLRFDATLNAADLRRWEVHIDSTGRLYIVSRNDDNSNTVNTLRLQRDGSGFDISGIRTIYGTGDPNGVYIAPVGSVFRNTETGGYNGARVWRKDSGTGNTSWVVEEGDTGWRDISETLDVSRWTLDGVTAPAFRVRREGSQVRLQVRVKAAASKVGTPITTSILMNLPTGFAAEGYAPIGTAMLDATRMAGVLHSQVGQASIHFAPDESHAAKSWLATNLLCASAYFTTAAAWPATLPGTAV